MRILARKFCSLNTLTADQLKNHLKACKGFEGVLKNLDIVSLDNGKCVAEMKIKEEHTNPIGTLHGGLTATLVDVVSSYGLSSLEKGNVAHVSVNLNVRYLKGGKLGKTVVIESETVRCGKTLAFLEVILKDKETGNILAKGEHTKYLLNA
ncbi:acyl-coenzyme A thioesterase 13-like [Coccinella septempunctata]|uniref:acyl-coenzyme A thioesterase 13-like n=1 Tax=Coccinella septempunctata TaxID=41139 RepID=UPI001D066434|nr:acyl-coenzyme A thioesterase 13-like [Coccinella septempunctata]